MSHLQVLPEDMAPSGATGVVATPKGTMPARAHMPGGEGAMRYFFLVPLLALAAVVFLLKVQNLDTVTEQFLWASLILPLSLLLLAAHVLGMLTGGTLVSLVRTWVRGAATKPPVSGCGLATLRQ